MEFLIFWALKIAGAVLSVPTAVILFFAARKKYRTEKIKKLIAADELANQFTSQFNENEIKDAISGYIIPHYSPSDPANKDGEEYLPDTRENLFDYLDRQIISNNKSYNLILADTGMGKTAFCLNYFTHLKKTTDSQRVALISLSPGDGISRIKKIKNKSSTILILDAFDEDKNSIADGMKNLSQVLQECADFKATIITCRSQFFLGEDQIPRETPLPRIVPRKLGQGANFTLTRGFISPFDEQQIKSYIRSHFPLWKIYNYRSRQRAYQLAREVPDLAYRPMLLERLPDLIERNNHSIELFDLYDILVEGWIRREENWIKGDNLRSVSFELALYLYRKSISDSPRISYNEVKQIAESSLGINPEWEHLHSRSLLNRDSQGRFKFSHRSILEFLIVRLAVEGDDRALELPWTPFMKELLVSWGHARTDSASANRAKAILASEDGRKNVSPLFDMWTAPPAFGLPDFKRVAQRRVAYNGDRLAPHTWRASSIRVSKSKRYETWQIVDEEFNLDWELIDNDLFKKSGIAETYNDLMSVVSNSATKQLPSYDQFIALVDGLYHSQRDEIIPDGDCFVLADVPEQGGKLIARLGTNLSTNRHLSLVDKERKVGVTKRCISVFMTGVSVSPSYGRHLKVRQLWLCRR